jgi:hypothetical protein
MFHIMCCPSSMMKSRKVHSTLGCESSFVQCTHAVYVTHPMVTDSCLAVRSAIMVLQCLCSRNAYLLNIVLKAQVLFSVLL